MSPHHQPSIERRPFGTAAGQPVDLYTLSGGDGPSVDVTTYGGIVTALRTRDRRGRLEDVVLGHETLDGYLAGNRPYLGALVGRYANRIARGRFTLDGREVQLLCNNGPNHLHGGGRGFDQLSWSASAGATAEGPRLELSRVSPDGEEGYPGRLEVTVGYTLGPDSLRLDYRASCDAPTHCNLTHHGYFNLDRAPDVRGHLLTLHARRFLPIDEGLIPTGELRPVEGTPMDFTRPTTVGARLDAGDQQLRLARGYDHCWVLDGDRGGGLAPAARLVGPASGRVLTVLTTEPGLQFYSGNFRDGSITGKGGQVYAARAGLCLETQHFPDSPNHPAFPSTVLRPGQVYRSSTVFRFSVE